jgi:hypothetical protein
LSIVKLFKVPEGRTRRRRSRRPSVIGLQATNLIVAQRARAHNVTIGFWEYFKVGAPLTILTILFGSWWL